jgi:hypothetical protein
MMPTPATEADAATANRRQRIVRDAEGLRVAAAWMLKNRAKLADLGCGDMGHMLYGGADDELKFYLYGHDAAKEVLCSRIRKAFPDLDWADDSTDNKIGIIAEIAGNFCVLFFGTRIDK